MNQVTEAIRAGALRQSQHEGSDPILAATEAVQRILAMAHEAGQEEAVRLLHAVGALLAAAPRH